MQVPLSDHRGTMGIKISEQIGVGATFVSGKIFIFGRIALFSDSTGHLGQVETLAPGQIIRFGNMEYTVDVRGKLVFTSWASHQVEDQPEPLTLSSMLNPAQVERENPSPGPTLSWNLTSPPSALMSNQAEVEGEELRSMPDRILGKLPLVPVSDQARKEREKLPNVFS